MRHWIDHIKPGHCQHQHFQPLQKRLLIVHNLVSGQSIIHEFSETDFAFELVDGSPEPDENGELDVESKLFYRLDEFNEPMVDDCLAWPTMRSTPEATRDWQRHLMIAEEIAYDWLASSHRLKISNFCTCFQIKLIKDSDSAWILPSNLKQSYTLLDPDNGIDVNWFRVCMLKPSLLLILCWKSHWPAS